MGHNYFFLNNLDIIPEEGKICAPLEELGCEINLEFLNLSCLPAKFIELIILGALLPLLKNFENIRPIITFITSYLIRFLKN
jgi:hypothetical protein